MHNSLAFIQREIEASQDRHQERHEIQLMQRTEGISRRFDAQAPDIEAAYTHPQATSNEHEIRGRTITKNAVWNPAERDKTWRAVQIQVQDNH
jgi:hypothetical protein